MTIRSFPRRGLPITHRHRRSRLDPTLKVLAVGVLAAGIVFILLERLGSGTMPTHFLDGGC